MCWMEDTLSNEEMSVVLTVSRDSLRQQAIGHPGDMHGVQASIPAEHSMQQGITGANGIFQMIVRTHFVTMTKTMTLAVFFGMLKSDAHEVTDHLRGLKEVFFGEDAV
mmetsp:Transcript_28096/g.69788  ORF Transcript_28096/g.69788 Transcript_28096/m.69788 type:complete len:108 (+) Transcript_28096:496-819(+)